jgi:ribosomal protein S18 acetylase RimI-like enzyme
MTVGASGRGAIGTDRVGGRPPARQPVELDHVAMRAIDWHEARAHAIGGRLARDLGDAILLHDPRDRDPFWNRLSGLRMPVDPGAFDARLAELLALFAGLDRRPHVWAAPTHDQPTDLVGRLRDHGFDDVGGGLLMILDDDAAVPPALPGQGWSSQVLRQPPPDERRAVAADVAALLVAAFHVDPLVRSRLTEDLVIALDHPELVLYVVRAGPDAVAVAKRTTFEGASYLSSIATRPGWQGRGIGSFVTALACRDAISEGDRLVYLRVFPENARARSVYGRLGFATVGGRAADLLLGWT